MVPIIAGATMVLEGIDLVTSILTKLQAAGSIIQKAQSEGRTHFTDEEWIEVQKTADVPMDKLRAAIAAAPADKV